MFKAFVCEATGEYVDPQSCWQCAQKGALPGCHMTAPVINGIVQNMRPDDFGLTATTVLGCARKWRLKIEYPYALEPSSAYWLFRGQVFHDLVEGYTHVTSDNGALVEQRLSFLVEPSSLPEATNKHVRLSGDSVVLSGKPDVAFLHEGHLVDYKSTKKVHDKYYVYTFLAIWSITSPPRRFTTSTTSTPARTRAKSCGKGAGEGGVIMPSRIVLVASDTGRGTLKACTRPGPT